MWYWKKLPAALVLVTFVIFGAGCVEKATLKKAAQIGLTTVKIALQAAGGDLIKIAADNHGDKYSAQLENLLLAVVRDAWGLQVRPATPPPGGCVYRQTSYGGQDVQLYCGDTQPVCDPYTDPNCQPPAVPSQPYPTPPQPGVTTCDPYTDPNCQPGNFPAQPTPGGGCDPYTDPNCQPGNFPIQPTPGGGCDPYIDPNCQPGNYPVQPTPGGGGCDPYTDPNCQPGIYPVQPTPGNGGCDPYTDPNCQPGNYPVQPTPGGGGCDPYTDPNCQPGNFPVQPTPGNGGCDPYTDPNCQPGNYPVQPTPGGGGCDPYTDPNCQNLTNRNGNNTSEQIAFDFTLLKHTPNGSLPIQDGDVLYGPTPGRPEDKIKINFSTTCACYVYIVGIDSTGFTAQIYPDPESGAANPAQPDRNYVLPAGNTWWGLDEQPGKETIYLIISRQPRPDIDSILATMSANSVPDGGRGAQKPVTDIPVLEGRGLRKVSVAGSQVPGGTLARADSYVTSFDNIQADAILTRWFQHQ